MGAAVHPLAGRCRSVLPTLTYVKVGGQWRYVYRAVDQYRQVIDVLVLTRRDADAARRFFRRALSALKVQPTEVVTDAAAGLPRCAG